MVFNRKSNKDVTINAIICLLIGITGDWTQGLTFAWQALYNWAMPTVILLLVGFSGGVLYFAVLRPWSSTCASWVAWIVVVHPIPNPHNDFV
jgi:hypothetical protein